MPLHSNDKKEQQVNTPKCDPEKCTCSCKNCYGLRTKFQHCWNHYRGCHRGCDL